MQTRTSKIIACVFSSAASLGCTFLILSSYKSFSSETMSVMHMAHLCVLCTLFSVPLMVLWRYQLRWFAWGVGVLASSVVCLTILKTTEGIYGMYILWYGIFLGWLQWQHHTYQQSIVACDLESERLEQERNHYERSFVEKTEALEVFLHKYADYAHLKTVVDDLSVSLDLTKVCDLIVTHTLSMLGKGELVLLYLVDLDESSLSLIASKSIDRKRRTKLKKGDIFDQWVLKNKQQLLVPDITKDIRFDQELTREYDAFLCVMDAPLFYEGRVVGTLRVNAEKPETFTMDDVRVLTVIANIASAALSNAFLFQRTEELAIKDSLTGLYVHRYFKERLKEEHKRALLTQSSVSLLMADLDNFKTYNDHYGHTAGDLILKRTALLIQSIVEENGMVARYGGEEFAILMPSLKKQDAARFAEQIRERIQNESFDLRGVITKTTLSIGVASVPEDTLDAEELIRVADMRLYEAKRKAKNRVVS